MRARKIIHFVTASSLCRFVNKWKTNHVSKQSQIPKARPHSFPARQASMTLMYLTYRFPAIQDECLLIISCVCVWESSSSSLRGSFCTPVVQPDKKQVLAVPLCIYHVIPLAWQEGWPLQSLTKTIRCELKMYFQTLLGGNNFPRLGP